MRQIILAIIIVLLQLCSCGQKVMPKSEYFFICAGKFYDYETANEVAKTVRIRGGSGYIYSNNANYVLVSMHKAKELATSSLKNMPQNYFIIKMEIPKTADKTLIRLIERYCDYLDTNLYAEIDYEQYLENLQKTLQSDLENMTSEYLFLKANLFVVQKNISKSISKNEELESTAKYSQTDILITIIQFIKQQV